MYLLRQLSMLKIKRRQAFIGLLALSLTCACSDVFEEDLENDYVDLVYPVDNLVTEFSTQTFSWNSVDGADRYHIQIVNGNFISPNYFVLDSFLESISITYNLFPGTFQRRVRCENSVSESPYSIRSIRIDSSSDLSGTSINLLNPKNGLITNDSQFTFNWADVYNAEDYIFQIRQNDFTGPILFTDTIKETSYTLGSTLNEGIYGWGVKAINNSSASLFNSHTFTVDLSPPNVPGVTTRDSTQSNPFTLEWVHNSSDVNYDSLVIFTDLFLTNKIKSEQANLIYSDTLPVGIYYWQVKSIDFAGNQSSFSTRRRLEIVP